jgi:uncharacterized protein
MTQTQAQFASPLDTKDRLMPVDMLRGFAVLGILIMNIQSFSMPSAAYLNPSAYGAYGPVSKWTWVISHMIASEKFLSIFSMLFGAGIIIFTSHLKSRQLKQGGLHYRRMFWLLIFGLIHAYFLWYGDILVAYSLCGMLAFLFRKLKPATLVWIGILFFIVPILFYTMSSFTTQYWPDDTYNQLHDSWKPDQPTLNKEVLAMQGSWLQQMEYRIPGALFMQTGLFLMETFWRIMAMMLLGMALFKWELITAKFSKQNYLVLGFVGILVGSFISGIGVILNFENDWTMRFSMFMGRHFNYLGSVITALGYIGVIMLLSKSTHIRYLQFTLAAIGRTAFSNYILQTIICTFIFYGHGLGLFGQVNRAYQMMMVPAIWLVLMIVTLLWLKKFRYGPMEWLWRSLTYWKKQEFVRVKT